MNKFTGAEASNNNILTVATNNGEITFTKYKWYGVPVTNTEMFKVQLDNGRLMLIPLINIKYISELELD